MMRRAVTALTVSFALASGLSACAGDEVAPTATGSVQTEPSVANFCEQVIKHRTEYWAVAKGLTSVQGVKDLLSGRTNVSALGPMWRDLAAAAPGRIVNEVDLVNDKWTTMVSAYENRQWIKLTRTVGSLTGPMADVNRFVRLTCGTKYGPLG